MNTEIVALAKEGRRVVLGIRTVVQLVALFFLLFLVIFVVAFVREIPLWNVGIVVLGMTIVGVLCYRLIDTIPKAVALHSADTTPQSPELAQWIEAVDKMETINQVESIRILASASWRHHHIVEKLVRRFGLHSFKIDMLVRCDEGDSKRKERIAANIQEWNELAEEFHLELNIRYYSFAYMIRGICIDDKFALMGYYIREGDKTQGLNEPVMILRQGRELDNYLLKQFRRVHETLMITGRKEL